MEILKKYSAALTSLFVFIIYMITNAPSVIQIDSGELAAVQSTLGIAHPTGYPLFTLTGYLFLKLPLPFSHIYSANVLSGIWCALGIWMFIKSSNLLLSNISVSVIRPVKSKGKRVQVAEPKVDDLIKVLLPSILGGLFLAFGKTYWSQSTSVEVYPLQLFLFNLILYSVIKAYYSESESIKPWLWVAVALALGFANHMTTLLILPFIAFLFFDKEKFSSASIKKIGLMLLVFFPILILLYLYIPLRASTNPEVNWGNVVNFENFWRHFTGKQYQVWLFSSFDSAKKQLSYFLSNFPSEFAYAGLIIIITGIVYLFKSSKKIFWTIAVTFVFALLYAINYDISDIDSYFLASYIMLSFIALFGFQKSALYLSHKSKSKYSIALLSLFILIELPINFNEVDQSDMHTFEDYTLAVLNNADPNSIIFSYTWDYFVSPSYYFQYSEGIRRDVAVIDKELLRRSWYYNQMERDYPNVIKNIKPEINNFLEAVKPFERDENFNPNEIEGYYRSLMTNLVAANADQRTFYVGLELAQNEMRNGAFSLPKGYNLVPDLFMFKAVKGNEYVPAKNPDFNIRYPKNGNKYTNNIRSFIGDMLALRARYELLYNKPERAKIYINKIRKDFPDFRLPDDLIGK